jgi:hypothetical protein
MPPRRRHLRPRLVEAALAYPEAYEDFPWGEQVVKVNKKADKKTPSRLVSQ